MHIKSLITLIIGIIVALLGVLWFLQGAGIIYVCPILCFADCICLTHGSFSWKMIGAGVIVVGVLTALIGYRGQTVRSR